MRFIHDDVPVHRDGSLVLTANKGLSKTVSLVGAFSRMMETWQQYKGPVVTDEYIRMGVT